MVFNWLDVVICVVLLTVFIFGLRRGFLLTLGDMLGLVLGAVAAFFAIPWVSTFAANPWWRVGLMIAATVVLLALGQALGRAIATKIRRVMNVDFIRAADRLAGGVLSVFISAAIIGALAFTTSSMGMPGLSLQIGQSKMIAAIRSATPDAVTQAISNARSTLVAETIPEFLEPFAPPVPPAEEADWQASEAQLAAAASTAKVSGTAVECGVNLTGSGFVAAPGLVMTNAHVVAGLSSATVEVGKDEVHRGRVVYFDTDKDIALLRVEDLQAPSLPLASTPLGRGDNAAFIGYPAGGPQQVRGAVVASRATVSIADIYGEDPGSMSVYQLTANVAQGNSGGPLVDEQGEVAGLVFAKSRSDDSVGFALSLSEIQTALRAGAQRTEPLNTGMCLKE